MDITTERVNTLRDMAEHEHIELAYRLMAGRSTDNYEQRGISAALAVAHLLLATDKQRDARSTVHGRR